MRLMEKEIPPRMHPVMRDHNHEVCRLQNRLWDWTDSIGIGPTQLGLDRLNWDWIDGLC